MRHRPRRHGRSLRRCRRPMKFRPRRSQARGSRRRCSEVGRRMRRHGRALRHGRGMERRRGGTRHGWRRHRMGHCRWWCRPDWRRGWPCNRCSRSRWSTPSMVLGERADAHRQHRDTNQKSRQANATRKHDRRSQPVIAHNFQRAGGGIVRRWPRPALRSSAAGMERRAAWFGSTGLTMIHSSSAGSYRMIRSPQFGSLNNGHSATASWPGPGGF
jgi:hypothetical protein